MNERTLQRAALAAFIAVVLIGGTNFVAVRFSNRELPPFWGAALRFAGAAVVLFTVALVQRLPLPGGRALAGALLYGLLGFGGAYAFGYWGLQRVPAGLAAVVMAAAPLFTFALARLHGQEEFRWRPLLGGLVALAGIAFIFSRSASAAVPLTSLLAIVATALCAAEASVIVKGFPKSHPITTNAVGMLTGAVILGGLSVGFREPQSAPILPATWAALGYLILLGSSTAFVLYLFVLKHWSATAAAYQFVLFPLVAVALSAVLERTTVSPSFVLGGVAVLGGVYVGVAAKTPFVRTPHRLGTEPCLTCAE